MGEFVVNIATEAIARQVAAAAEPLEFDESEFELTGLTPVASSVVRLSRVAESPVAFECHTTQIIHTNPGVTGGGNIILGRVVGVQIDERLINDRYHVDQQALAAIGRMGGRGYVTTSEVFDLPMGVDALMRAADGSGERGTVGKSPSP